MCTVQLLTDHPATFPSLRYNYELLDLFLDFAVIFLFVNLLWFPWIISHIYTISDCHFSGCWMISRITNCFWALVHRGWRVIRLGAPMLTMHISLPEPCSWIPQTPHFSYRASQSLEFRASLAYKWTVTWWFFACVRRRSSDLTLKQAARASWCKIQSFSCCYDTVTSNDLVCTMIICCPPVLSSASAMVSKSGNYVWWPSFSNVDHCLYLWKVFNPPRRVAVFHATMQTQLFNSPLLDLLSVGVACCVSVIVLLALQ